MGNGKDGDCGGGRESPIKEGKIIIIIRERRKKGKGRGRGGEGGPDEKIGRLRFLKRIVRCRDAPT